MVTIHMEQVVAVYGVLNRNVMVLRKISWTATVKKLVQHILIQMMWESFVVVSYQAITSFLYLML